MLEGPLFDSLSALIETGRERKLVAPPRDTTTDPSAFGAHRDSGLPSRFRRRWDHLKKMFSFRA